MEVQRESVICSRCHSWWPIDNITLVWLLLMYFLPRHRHRRKRFGACLRSSVHAHTAVFHAAVRKGLIYAYLIGTATVLSLNLRNKGLGERLGFPPNPPPRQTGKPEWSCKRSWEIACMTSWWCFRAVIRKAWGSCYSCQACRLSFFLSVFKSKNSETLNLFSFKCYKPFRKQLSLGTCSLQKAPWRSAKM